ncbi:MAG: asparagine synthase (glutamine-hydrolyzing) [Myxococcales bacterium]|nr:asparagine synthase (glutamine-hydrolyzing) [Myxococcales bacterium]
MCGIFGAIGDATDEALAAGCAALQHRGPDAHGVWRSGQDGLAHTRLKIIDLSEAAAQPMAGCDPQVRVTFNGEIYNHRDLRALLEAKGHHFRSRSDSEAIIHGYEEWGPAVIERLDGMFALGIWDAARRRLVLARDRTGKKPLFYTLSPDGRTLRFASEVKALVAAGHPDALDPAALPMFLSWGYVPAPATIHKGVHQLPPASRLVHEPGRHAPRVDTWWRPTFLEPPLAIPYDQARARVRELVIAAVQRRLESDVPLGAFLSGGIDSTIVVGVMAKLLGQKVRTFSIGFPGDPAFDESPAARATARLFGTEHTEFHLAPSSASLIEKLVWLHDGPFGDSSAIPTHTVSKLTRQHVTVALSGDGGDELFAGYLRFLAAEVAERVPAPLRSGLGAAARLFPGGLPFHSLGARAGRFLQGVALPLGDRISRWNSSFAFDLEQTIRPELQPSLDLGGPLEWQRSFFDGRGTTLARILDHNFRTYLAFDLQTKLDRCSAGNALEVRAPLLDTALVEYAGRLPDGFKRRGTRTKHILRDAFSDLIPEAIARRPKRGFGVPLGAWFKGELAPYLQDTLGRGAHATIDSLLQRSTVDGLIADHLAGRADHSAKLFTLLTLEVWLRSLRPAATRPDRLFAVGAAS